MGYDVEVDKIADCGLRYIVIKIHNHHRCGYVAVEQSSPLYGKEYSEEVPELRSLIEEAEESANMENRGAILCLLMSMSGILPRMDHVLGVHGGITFASGDGEYPVSEDGLWWIGFDCGHAGDENEDWTTEAVEQQCILLAEQLVKVVKDDQINDVTG